MKKLIVILEDNSDRAQAMKDWLEERFYMYEQFISDDPDTVIQQIRSRINDVVAVSLDHDLHERPDFSTELTGMMVAEFLATQTPQFPVLLHTTNTRDGDRMQQLLTESKWTVERVIPFDGVTWISRDWHQSLKKTLQTRMPKMRVSKNDSHDDIQLVQEPTPV
jgi:CheY-like chemotaxis protein